MADDTQIFDETNKAAHSRWKARGEPAGDAWADWFPAERKINRFLYHNFPRRWRDAVQENQKGLDILRSMADFGLLLTPEVHTVTEQISPDRSTTLQVVQQRFCLTDLTPNEVPWHSAEFGRFGLEFDIEVARNLAAFPVMYFPNNPQNTEGASWMGRSLIARLGVISDKMLPRIQKLLNDAMAAAPNADAVIHTFRDGTRLTAGLVPHLVDYLLEGLYTPGELEAAVRASSNFWGPTENLKYNSLMHYYQQREWRISPAVTRPGLVFAPPTQAHIQALMTIDPEYFSKTLAHQREPMPTLQACSVLRIVNGHHILRFVRRFIVPSCVVPDTAAILQPLGPNPPVVGIETLWL